MRYLITAMHRKISARGVSLPLSDWEVYHDWTDRSPAHWAAAQARFNARVADEGQHPYYQVVLTHSEPVPDDVSDDDLDLVCRMSGDGRLRGG